MLFHHISSVKEICKLPIRHEFECRLAPDLDREMLPSLLSTSWFQKQVELLK